MRILGAIEVLGRNCSRWGAIRYGRYQRFQETHTLQKVTDADGQYRHVKHDKRIYIVKVTAKKKTKRLGRITPSSA